MSLAIGFGCVILSRTQTVLFRPEQKVLDKGKNMKKNLKELEKKIGYEFQDFSLLEQAMMHSSYTNEKHLEKYHCNERLEFLGDAVFRAGVQ